MQNKHRLPVNDVESLWNLLNQRTQALKIEYLNSEEVPGRFSQLGCPKATAICINNHYLHANRVGEGVSSKVYIASQAPIPVSFELFWRSACIHGSIIDLTKKAIPEYYPEIIGEAVDFGVIQVTLLRKEEVNLLNFYYYNVMDAVTKQTRQIERIHFMHWIDLCAIDVNDLMILVDNLRAISREEIPCVHCVAGVGRTGTLITATILKEKIDNHEIKAEDLAERLLDLIIKLREQRGKYFVETKEQFELLLRYGSELLT